MLEGLTTPLAREFGAVPLFDLPHRETMFRVLLLQGCLQVDLSVTPASSFGPNGPKFRILFGNYTENPAIPAPSAAHLLGYAAHHATRARFCIERSRFWQAEYWLSAARDYALSLACLQRNLSPHYGRGFDQLPAEIRARAQGCLGQVPGSPRTPACSGVRSQWTFARGSADHWRSSRSGTSSARIDNPMA